VGQGSATLNATVNPNGGEVSGCVLEYGPGTAYGSSAACSPSPGSGSSAVAVSASVGGLGAGSTYHFRVSATNAGGTSVGADRSFTTLPPAGTAPELGRCKKVTTGTGKYENAGCTKSGGSKSYEWSPGVARTHFTTKIKESATASLLTVKGSRVTCLGETSTGEYTGPKTVGGVVLTFTGCERLGEKCSTAGAAGEIATTPLEGALGVIKVSTEGPLKNQIGLDLFPVGRTGFVMVFSCGATPASVRGSVIMPVTVNMMKLTSTLSYEQSKGKQRVESFSGEPRDVLEAAFVTGAFEQTGLTLKTILTSEEMVEVNSVA
jgi:hypothetical protein